MELVKDIYFNTDKLIENTKVKVSYTGKFYQTKNEKVYIHYGYGKNWNNVKEVEMTKTDLGYQIELNLTGGDTLNFCFKNQNNEWDNNFGKNYIFAIEKTSNTGVGKSTVGTSNNNFVFWGRTYTKNRENYKNNNIYWTGENTQTTEKNVVQSVDTFIPNTGHKISMVQQKNTTGTVNGFSTIGEISHRSSPTTTVTYQNTSVQNNSYIPNTEVNFTRNVNQTFPGVTSTTTTPNITTNVVGTNTNNTVNANTTLTTNTLTGNVNNTATTNIFNPVKPETSITIAPTGFNYWTKKIKETVCKFFSYVPKLISGNYKRNLSKNNKK